MFCTHCGAQLPNDARFCSSCGATLPGEVSSNLKLPRTEPAQVTNHYQPATVPRYENRVLQIAPAEEMSTIQKHEAFGWELMSTQTIDTTNSRFESNTGEDLWQITERKNYVKLSFRRDMNRPNYAKLAELESQYDKAKFRGPGKPVETKWPKICGIIAIIIGIFGIISALSSGEVINIFGGVIAIVVGVCLLSWYRKLEEEYLADLSRWEASNANNSVERDNIIQQARSLL